MKNNSSAYDLELSRQLKEQIEMGDVEVINDPAPYFEMIETRFPISMNRIDWTAVYDFKFVDVSNFSGKEKLDVVQSFVANLDIKTKNQYVVIIGDGAQEYAYRMKFESVRKLIGHFIDLPQHTFVLFENESACINYTFEDELYFGRALKFE